MKEGVSGSNSLPPAELAKIYEELGHEVALDSPKMALELLDKANEIRMKANQDMLDDEAEMEAYAKETADRLGMSEENKAKFLRNVQRVLRSTRSSI